MKTIRVVVVGAGVVGFSSAVCIAEALPLCSVTLLADRFSPDTTSDVAAGILLGELVPDVPLERQERWFKDTFDHLLAVAHSEEAPEAGVMVISGCQIFKEVPANIKPFWSETVIAFRSMTDRELRRFPGYKFGQAFSTLKCECSSYLLWLDKRFSRAGGLVERRKIHSLEELSCDIIVNCTGLGSKALVGDDTMYPIRGQVLKMEAPWLKNFVRCGDGKTYVYPGIHSVTLGGIRQRDEWRLEVDPEDTKSILERCGEVEPSLSRGRVLEACVGLRPGRKSPRVETEMMLLKGRRVPVVHNYGHGGWGVSLSWGTAQDALGLVRRCIQEMQLQAKL